MSLTYVRTNFRRQNCSALSGCRPEARRSYDRTSSQNKARRLFPLDAPSGFLAALRPGGIAAAPHCSSSYRPVPRRHRLRPRKIRNQCRSSEEFRSQEVTACDGTFPDFATSPYGFDTRIGRCSFARQEKGCFPPPSATGCAPSGHNDPMFRGIRERPCSGLPRSTSFPGLCSPKNVCYQLALVTPGISPLEAISRNWIRLMPNRRM